MKKNLVFVLILFLLFIFINNTYGDRFIKNNNSIIFSIKMENLPDKFFLEKIYSVLSFEGDRIIEEYFDLKIKFSVCNGEEFAIFEIPIPDGMLSNKYLFRFYGGYIIIELKNNEISEISIGFY